MGFFQCREGVGWPGLGGLAQQQRSCMTYKTLTGMLGVVAGVEWIVIWHQAAEIESLKGNVEELTRQCRDLRTLRAIDDQLFRRIQQEAAASVARSYTNRALQRELDDRCEDDRAEPPPPPPAGRFGLVDTL